MKSPWYRSLFFAVIASTPGCSADTDPPPVAAATDAGSGMMETARDDAMTDASAMPDVGLPDDGDAGAPDAPPEYPTPTFGLSRRSVEHDGANRDYLVYVPQSYTHETPTPVILNFHGNGGTADGHLQAADLRDIAETDSVILVYPQGSLLDGEGSHWNPLLESENNKSDADDFGFVSAILDTLIGDFRIDETRVYATGYSNGAGFTYGLACYLSDRIAAVAPVSGSMYIEMQDNCSPTHPTAIAIFNGTRDEVRPYDGYPDFLLSVNDAMAYWRTHNNISDPPATASFDTNGLTVERSLYSGGTNGVEADIYKVIGGDHVWFEIEIEGADQGQLIWNFLSRHDRAGAR